jgi:hypothetical protein
MPAQKRHTATRGIKLLLLPIRHEILDEDDNVVAQLTHLSLLQPELVLLRAPTFPILWRKQNKHTLIFIIATHLQCVGLANCACIS